MNNTFSGRKKKVMKIINKREESPETLRLIERRKEITKLKGLTKIHPESDIFWRPRMKKDIENRCNTCSACKSSGI